MKTILFSLICFCATATLAEQPSLDQIASSFFSAAGIQVRNVEINELENPFESPNSKEIFFYHGSTYYNCTLDVPNVRYNPVGRAYDVSGFNLRNCENYENRESIDLPTQNHRLLRAVHNFREGVVFFNNNSQVEESAVFYSEERIGRRPR